MYKRLFFKNIILTSILSIILIIFISLTISLNYNTQVDETAYTHYLNLPFYFKLIFITFIPIFSDYNYLYQFIMLYFLWCLLRIPFLHLGIVQTSLTLHSIYRKGYQFAGKSL